ncbi:MAG: TSUP family transporter [Gemmatimonadales bacterium]
MLGLLALDAIPDVFATVMQASLLLLAGLFALSVLSGGTAAVLGFGIGSLLTPYLAGVSGLAPEVVVAAVALPHLLATALRFVQHQRSVDRRAFVRFGVWSAVGGLAGALLQPWLASQALLGVLGLLLVATGIAQVTRGVREWHPESGWVPALGLLSGVGGGLVGNQGGLRAAGLAPFGLPPRTFVATSTAVALAVDLVRTPVYLWRHGSALADWRIPIGVAVVGCLIGTVLGERVLLGLSPHRYRLAIGAAIALVGLWLVAQGTGLAGP